MKNTVSEVTEVLGKDHSLNSVSEPKNQLILNRAIIKEDKPVKKKMFLMREPEINAFLQMLSPDFVFMRFQMENMDKPEMADGQQRGIWYRVNKNIPESESKFMPFSNIGFINYCYSLGNIDISEALMEHMVTFNQLNDGFQIYQSHLNNVIKMVESGESPKPKVKRLQAYFEEAFK